MKAKIIDVDGAIIYRLFDGKCVVICQYKRGQREHVFFETLAEAARFVLDVEEGKV